MSPLAVDLLEEKMIDAIMDDKKEEKPALDMKAAEEALLKEREDLEKLMKSVPTADYSGRKERGWKVNDGKEIELEEEIELRPATGTEVLSFYLRALIVLAAKLRVTRPFQTDNAQDKIKDMMWLLRQCQLMLAKKGYLQAFHKVPQEWKSDGERFKMLQKDPKTGKEIEVDVELQLPREFVEWFEPDLALFKVFSETTDTTDYWRDQKAKGKAVPAGMYIPNPDHTKADTRFGKGKKEAVVTSKRYAAALKK